MSTLIASVEFLMNWDGGEIADYLDNYRYPILLCTLRFTYGIYLTETILPIAQT